MTDRESATIIDWMTAAYAASVPNPHADNHDSHYFAVMNQIELRSCNKLAYTFSQKIVRPRP